MARISGIDIPRNKRIEIALTYIHGIGRSRSSEILKKVGVDKDRKVSDLSEDEVSGIRNVIDSKKYRLEGELKREVSVNIKRLTDIKSYRGSRHERNLPSRGQRTRTNARTRRGKRKTIGGLKVKVTKT